MKERLESSEEAREGHPTDAGQPRPSLARLSDCGGRLPIDGFPACRLVLAARLTSRLRGLLMSPASDAILLLAPCRDIHTFGMGYAIDVAFIDEAGRVLESRRDVMPNRRLRNARASAVLERYAIPREVWFEAGDSLRIGAYRCVQGPSEFDSSRKEEQ